MKKIINIMMLLTIAVYAEVIQVSSGDSLVGEVVHLEMKYYKIHVKKGETLDVNLSEISGDPDLYIKAHSEPSIDDYDRESDNGMGLNEHGRLELSADTDVFIGVYGYTDGQYTLSVNLSQKPVETLVSAESIVSSVALEEMKYYKILGKKNANIKVTLTEVDGDPDLYLKMNAKPTVEVYDSESDNSSGLEESSNMMLNADGILYIGVYGYQSASYKLTATTDTVDNELTTVLYEDAEDFTIDRWNIIDNIPLGAVIENVFDNEKNTRVMKFTNEGNGDADSNAYHLVALENNQNNFNIKWDMKTAEEYIVDVAITTANGDRVLRYSDYFEDYINHVGEMITYGLGKASINGDWHTFNRDLEKDLKGVEFNNEILSVDSLIIRAKGSFDNIELYTKPNKIYENAEAGSLDKWKIYTGDENSSIENIYDNERKSNVISFLGSNFRSQYLIGSFFNNDGAWADRKHTNIKWSMKHTSNCIIQVNVNTQKGERYIEYSDKDISIKGIDGEEIFYGLGTNSSNGQWHTYIRDVAADIIALEPDNALLSIEGVLVLGSTKIDDLELFNVLNPANHKAGLSLTFDDTDVNGWYGLRNMLLKYKIKPTFFVSYFSEFNEEEINKLKTLEQDGAEIGCHTYSHRGIERDFNNDTARIEEYITEQIESASNLMQAAGFNPQSFAHPYGETEKSFNNAIRAYFPYLRGLSEARGRLVQRDDIFLKKGNPFNILQATTIDNGYRDLEQIREAMVRARENGEILSLYGHHIKNDYNTAYIVPSSELEKILEMSYEIGLKSYTYKETYLLGQ